VTRKAIVILPLLTCAVLFGRGESRPWKMDPVSNAEPQGPIPVSLDQVKAESNPVRRAKAGADFAAVAERNAEAVFSKGDIKTVATELNAMQESIEIARDSLIASKETPGRNPELYKYVEIRSRKLLIRLEDFAQRMFVEDRDLVAAPKARVQEIHDFWFDEIMRRKQ
jgi:hypothetical protein